MQQIRYLSKEEAEGMEIGVFVEPDLEFGKGLVDVLDQAAEEKRVADMFAGVGNFGD